MRIGIAGISHEALTFSPVPQTMKDFRVLRGREVLQLKGLAPAAEELNFEPVPILVANARCPSGVVEERTYVDLRAELLENLRRAGSLDGICLVLHGAMLVENIWSGETDQVRTVRAAVGREIPLAVRLGRCAACRRQRRGHRGGRRTPSGSSPAGAAAGADDVGPAARVYVRPGSGAVGGRGDRRSAAGEGADGVHRRFRRQPDGGSA